MLNARSFIGIFKPEYLFRPQQILLKFSRELRGRRQEMSTAYLPWGLKIKVNTRESLGWSVYTRAIYETAVTEALWRLTNPGDWVVDGGANIGYMTSLLAVRVGGSGKVLSFEPHPEIFSQLQANVESWRKEGVSERIELYQTALGEAEGFGELHTPLFFSQNAGTPYLGHRADDKEAALQRVAVRTLDSIIPTDQKVGLVKLDVEGFELAVLKGMKNLLLERRVQHVVFEEFGTYPAATHQFLSDLGYTIYGLEHSFGGIRFIKNQPPHYEPISGPPPNYLATIESPQNLKRIESGFWQSFGPLSIYRH